MADFYILIGNSNCRGSAANSGLSSAYTGTFSSIKFWTGSAYASLQKSIANDYPTQTSDGGYIYAFLKRMQQNRAATIYAIMHASGGTNLYSDWLPTNRGGLCDQAISTINAALINAWNVLGIRDYKFYICVDLGESDTDTEAHANAVAANTTALINAITGNLNGTALVTNVKKKLVGRLGSNQTGYDFLTEVMTSQNTLSDSDTAVINQNDRELQGDGHHGTCLGYETVGITRSDTIINNGW